MKYICRKVEILEMAISYHFELKGDGMALSIPQNDIHFRDWHLLEIDTTNCEMDQDSPLLREREKIIIERSEICSPLLDIFFHNKSFCLVFYGAHRSSMYPRGNKKMWPCFFDMNTFVENWLLPPKISELSHKAFSFLIYDHPWIHK